MPALLQLYYQRAGRPPPPLSLPLHFLPYQSQSPPSPAVPQAGAHLDPPPKHLVVSGLIDDVPKGGGGVPPPCATALCHRPENHHCCAICRTPSPALHQLI